MKKNSILIITAALVLAGAAALYFLVLRDAGERGDQPRELYSFLPGDYFVTNVKDSEKLLKVTVVLMLDTDKLDEKLGRDESVIRDTIINMLRSLTEEDILSRDIMDRLRTELRDSLNSVLGIDNIVTVYFNDFVMQ